MYIGSYTGSYIDELAALERELPRDVHQCTPMYTNVHQCTRMYTNVHPCTPAELGALERELPRDVHAAPLHVERDHLHRADAAVLDGLGEGAEARRAAARTAA